MWDPQCTRILCRNHPIIWWGKSLFSRQPKQGAFLRPPAAPAAQVRCWLWKTFKKPLKEKTHFSQPIPKRCSGIVFSAGGSKEIPSSPTVSDPFVTLEKLFSKSPTTRSPENEVKTVNRQPMHSSTFRKLSTLGPEKTDYLGGVKIPKKTIKVPVTLGLRWVLWKSFRSQVPQVDRQKQLEESRASVRCPASSEKPGTTEMVSYFSFWVGGISLWFYSTCNTWA